MAELRTKARQETEELMTIDEAAAFLHLNKQTIYKKIRNKEYPYIKKGKKLLFLKADLVKHLRADTTEPVKKAPRNKNVAAIVSEFLENKDKD